MPDMEITPGIRRLGPGLVNAYLVEDRGAVTIIDCGAPAYWNALPAELAAMGRTLDDVRAVVLTHAHTDHARLVLPGHGAAWTSGLSEALRLVRSAGT